MASEERKHHRGVWVAAGYWSGCFGEREDCGHYCYGEQKARAPSRQAESGGRLLGPLPWQAGSASTVEAYEKQQEAAGADAMTSWWRMRRRGI